MTVIRYRYWYVGTENMIEKDDVTFCARSLCRLRRCTLLVGTTWIFNRYICFQKIEKRRILVLKNHCFQTKKQRI